MGPRDSEAPAASPPAAHGRRPCTRRALAALPGGAAAVVVAACGTTGPGGDVPPAAITAPATIVAWFDTSGSGTTTFAPFHEAQLDVFRKANPKVNVNVEPIGDGNKLQANVVAGTPPDIFRTSYPTMYLYQKQGVLEPIDAYLDKRGKGDFYEWARDISTIGGKMYEWPWMLNPVGPVVNRSLFKEKNADALLPQPGPKADWTFDQWKTAMRAVTSVTGDPDKDTYGTAFAAKTTTGDYYMMMYMWSNGAELFDRDQTRVLANSPEGVTAVQMLADLVARDRLARPEPWNEDTAALRPLYQRKRLAILNGAPSDIADVEAGLKSGSILPPFEPQFMPVPHGPGKKATTFIAVQSFVVFRQPKDLDRTRAAMRLGFQVTDDAAQRAIVPLGQLPVRKSVGNIYPDDVNRTTALATLDNGRDEGRLPEVAEIRTLFNAMAKDVFQGNKSPKDALDEMVRLSAPIMAKSAAR
jgi:multiple sugar transport system substrate-binding protein